MLQDEHDDCQQTSNSSPCIPLLYKNDVQVQETVFLASSAIDFEFLERSSYKTPLREMHIEGKTPGGDLFFSCLKENLNT